LNAIAILDKIGILSVSIAIRVRGQNRLYGITISPSNCTSRAIFISIPDNKRRDSRAPVADNYRAATNISWTSSSRNASIDAVSVCERIGRSKKTFGQNRNISPRTRDLTLSINLTQNNIASSAAVNCANIARIPLRRRVNFSSINITIGIEQNIACITSRRGVDIARSDISASIQIDIATIVRGSRIKILSCDLSFLAVQRNPGWRGNILGGNVISCSNVDRHRISGNIILNIDAVESSLAADRTAKLNNSRIWLDREIVRPVNCRIKSNVARLQNVNREVVRQCYGSRKCNIVAVSFDTSARSNTICLNIYIAAIHRGAGSKSAGINTRCRHIFLSIYDNISAFAIGCGSNQRASSCVNITAALNAKIAAIGVESG